MPSMRKNRSLILTSIAILLCSALLWPQSVFERSSKTDFPLISGAAGGLGLSFYLGKTLKPLTLKEVGDLLPQNELFFDRWACNNFSQKADRLSDIFLSICVISPLLLLPSPTLDRNQKWTYALMYAETEILTYSITEITKCVVKRIRPYAYNPEIPLNNKITSSDARKSFFSGHTSASFASVVFLARTYSAFYPESRWKSVVWAAGLSAATFTGIQRILAGKHFLTDVLVGALVGSFMGFVIPNLHKIERTEKQSSNMTFQVSFRFSF